MTSGDITCASTYNRNVAESDLLLGQLVIMRVRGVLATVSRDLYIAARATSDDVVVHVVIDHPGRQLEVVLRYKSFAVWILLMQYMNSLSVGSLCMAIRNI